jgi:hypothetical protein
MYCQTVSIYCQTVCVFCQTVRVFCQTVCVVKLSVCVVKLSVCIVKLSACIVKLIVYTYCQTACMQYMVKLCVIANTLYICTVCIVKLSKGIDTISMDFDPLNVAIGAFFCSF